MIGPTGSRPGGGDTRWWVIGSLWVVVLVLGFLGLRSYQQQELGGTS